MALCSTSQAACRRLSVGSRSSAASLRTARPSSTAHSTRTTVIRVTAGKGFSKKAAAQKKAREDAKKPSKEELAQNVASSQYDDIVKKGGEVYAAFVRLKGPGPGPDGKCQWFPVGPIAVEKPSQIEKALWNAEKPLVVAVKKMYPQVYMKSVETGLEIGYRLRDAPQMSEAEIKAGGNPFDNVIPLTSPADRTVSIQSNNPLSEAFKNFEKIFTK
mmetsp:Transcript_5391/g.15013  ORF Transcript_5391/g.15013 Transcript_5391/m.15013 type:complete len:216 (+) Transcript_5391:105-752(+)|eukprot:CAMPEP_0117653244 /NCGR_PEP_ID=MMETSP0804-20121206/3081_1 /TAXON_ID=1074897 /ORGANISM="Tetraselmis astigmatica, Strain CCMP880" /LENGTH=215 /DNA_ID=CAMNT_0005459393 /DNA_START=40 /DNA_END=687 /DNA_ORIENTATION=-